MYIDPSWCPDNCQLWRSLVSPKYIEHLDYFREFSQVTCTKEHSHCINDSPTQSNKIGNHLWPPSCTFWKLFSCNCEASFTSKIPSPLPMFWVVAFIPGTLEEQLRKNANVRRSSLLKNFPLFVIFAFGFLVLFVLGFTTSFPTSLWLFLSGGVVGLCCTVPFGVAVLHAVTVPLSRCAWPDFGSETFDKLHRQYPTLRWDYCQDGRDTKIQVIRIQPEDWVHYIAMLFVLVHPNIA